MTRAYALEIKARALALRDGGMTQDQVAAELGVSSSVISLWERKRRVVLNHTVQNEREAEMKHVHRYPPEVRERARALRAERRSFVEIGVLLGISASVVHTWERAGWEDGRRRLSDRTIPKRKRRPITTMRAADTLPMPFGAGAREWYRITTGIAEALKRLRDYGGMVKVAENWSAESRLNYLMALDGLIGRLTDCRRDLAALDDTANIVRFRESPGRRG